VGDAGGVDDSGELQLDVVGAEVVEEAAALALGEGLPLFHGLPEPLRLVLASSTVYTDGSVSQVYTPA
jgi:hypothetical protein